MESEAVAQGGDGGLGKLAVEENLQAGGFAGAAVLLAVQMGVARGIFSNEAGLGSAPMAHAAAKSDDPVGQGTVAMLGTFIDTIVICTVTALVILVSGKWADGLSGATARAWAPDASRSVTHSASKTRVVTG